MGYALVVIGLAALSRRLLGAARSRGAAGQLRRSGALYVVHALLLAVIAVSPWYTGRVQADALVGLVESISAQSPELVKAADADVAALRAAGHDEVADWVEAYADGDRAFMKNGLDDLYQDISAPNRAIIWAFSGDRIQDGYHAVVDSQDYRALPLLLADVTAGRFCDNDEDWSRLIDNVSGDPKSYTDSTVSDAALKAIEEDCEGVMDAIDRDRLRAALNDAPQPSLKKVLVPALLLQYSPGEMSR